MHHTSQPTRRDFLRTASAAVLAAGAGAAALPAHAAPAPSSAAAQAPATPLPAHYLLTAVRLETGFDQTRGAVSATQTGLFALEINNGLLAGVHAQVPASLQSLPRVDAGGRLALPALRDMHIHLDKTWYGGPWRAPESRRGKTILDMIAFEQRELPKMLTTSVAHAEALIRLLASFGTTQARSHCNIDPVSGLKSLEHLKQALANNTQTLSCEIVAFPQHGLLRSKVDGLMREAMSLGVDHVGGLDPTTVDGDMGRSLDAMFQIALDHDKGIDIHLHESGASGQAAITYMLDTVERTPELKNRLTISHAFALANLEEATLDATAERMHALGVTIASTVPMGRSTMPLPRLREKGVTVVSGTDSVIDMWSPFGTGDMLEKSNLYAQLYGGYDELGLSRALGLVTGGVLPLAADGTQHWPRVGDAADFMLVDSTCSAEAVARRSPRVATFKQGRVVAGAV